jgi:hypothetical protein
MERHEVVNQIIDYLESRTHDIQEALQIANDDGDVADINYLEGSLETYDHLIAKLEDDYR